jgi:glc operon protein GlcG
MKTTKWAVVTAAALAVLCGGAGAQDKTEKPDKSDTIEAGTPARGLPKGPVRAMTVELAKQLVAAAKKSSCSPPKGSCSGAFAVVDDAGVLVYLEIIDGVLAGGPDLAIKKAKTPALWRRPTQVFQDAVNNKTNTSYADGTFSDMTTSPGGVPITKDGRMVGGVGIAAVGQATKQIDDAILAEATKIFGQQWF